MISFKSKVVIKIFDYYFMNQEASHYINELAKILGVDPKNLHRKLKELEDEGVLQSEFRGKERYFFLNKSNPLLDHYKQIFLKTHGLENKLKNIVREIKGIDKAYIFGSYVKDKMDSSSDIDVLAVGNHSVLELQKKINSLQKETGREINVINMGKKEFDLKRKKDQFVKNILKSKPIQIK